MGVKLLICINYHAFLAFNYGKYYATGYFLQIGIIIASV